MDFYQVVNARRTVREWSKKPVSAATIEHILDAGLAAPSNNHLREWEFIVLNSPEEKMIALQFVKEWAENHAGSVNIGATETARKMYAYAVPRQFSMLNDAPYVIIPLFKAGPGLFKPTAINSLNPFASIWCVIENIFLASTAEGLSCSMRIPVGAEGGHVCAALGVPEEYIMPAYIGVGYPGEYAEKPEQIQFTSSQKIHYGKW